jgi:cytochrome oxidase Cu insertion factor (SCO1/SenC/PrrC family)
MSHRRTAQSLAGMLFAVVGLAAPAHGQPAQPQPPAQSQPPAQPQPPPQYSAVLNVGDQAPAFKLPASDGKEYSLSDLKGKTVVLAWFPKAFTGG